MRRRPLDRRSVVLLRMTARSRRADAAALARRIRFGPGAERGVAPKIRPGR